MVSFIRRCPRAIVGLLFGCLPLAAQLDPRLQTTKTDFLDLFQPSGSGTAVKPEILTIFDFSGSMNEMMYHPLYLNEATKDADSSTLLGWSFKLSNSTVTATLVKGSSTSYSSTILIKPDGTQVTSSDAAKASTTSGLDGASGGASDVRNWVRAASHVRFAKTSGGVTRTIDIPVAWKVMNATSSGNPLSSMTVWDPKFSVTDSTGASTTYGSDTSIEVDLNYAYNGGDGVFTNGSSSSVKIAQKVCFDPTYVNWLFTGTYTDGPYKGKYVVYDAANASLVGGQSDVKWGQGFGTFANGATITVPFYNSNNTYDYDAITGALVETTVAANTLIIPARNRVQATKEAAIKAWVQNQSKVIWAFRYLDNDNEASNGNATTIDNKSTTTFSSESPEIGNDSAWILLNDDSLGGMKKIASMWTSGSTPLTYAVARGLAQFSDNASTSVFTKYAIKNPPYECMGHYLILFTDGQDNNGYGPSYPNTNYSTPYIGSGNAGNALTGNAAILKSTSSVDRTGSFWNLFTFAGIAAHMAPTSADELKDMVDYKAVPTSYPSSGSPSSYLPFGIRSRGGVTFDNNHRITTMTVGVSLGGKYSTSTSSTTGEVYPKYSLFAAAAVGDATVGSWDLDGLKPFELDPEAATPTKKAGTTYFLDATDPDKLTAGLSAIFASLPLPQSLNSVAGPNLPNVGAALGNQVYLGTFDPPDIASPVWSGDLLMFSTRTSGSKTSILDRSGNATSTLNSTTAQWVASGIFDSTSSNYRLWSKRNLYTRIPGTSAKPEPGLSTFTDSGSGFTALKPYACTSLSTDSEKQAVLQYAAGGDTATLGSDGRPTANRSNVMGDIVNSTPTALEYTFSGISSLPARLSAFSGAQRFRLILVGSNQGWLHAFGEVSKTTTVDDPADGGSKTVDIVSGAVDELWSFMPTDFLANLDYLKNSSNTHRSMVDGSPSIYFLDLPPSTGGSGNGTLDIGNTSTSERAIAVIGLRKGGRSYYALDIHDPFTPSLKWSLVPDEADYFPDSRIETGGPALATVKSILKNWGFSSCTPAFGRVLFNGVLRDAVFLGGGYSTPDVDTAFGLSSATNGLGRSVLALDVYSGKVLAAVDMSAGTSCPAGGPISAGLIPFEFFLNSGMAQRAYFLDAAGGLWSWGQQKVWAKDPKYSTLDANVDYRVDSSELSTWSLRKVAQDGSGKNAIYTTLPTPFRVGAFPGHGKDGKPTPAAVGVAMVSGDRNNPLDYTKGYTTQPTQHRLTVIFDRQDHKVWDPEDSAITDSDLLDAYPSGKSYQATDGVVTAGNAAYFLAPQDSTGAYIEPKLGYYRAFIDSTQDAFTPKGINSPSVVAGSLFYAFFTPTEADPCAGGTGITESWRLYDVFSPIVADTRTSLSCASGLAYTWVGLTSGFAGSGTTGVIVAGVDPTSASGTTTTGVQVETILGKQQERYPKARVWRIVR